MKRLLAVACLAVLVLAPACCHKPCDMGCAKDECPPRVDQCVEICPPAPCCREVCPPKVECTVEKVPVQVYRKIKRCTTEIPCQEVEFSCDATDIVTESQQENVQGEGYNIMSAGASKREMNKQKANGADYGMKPMRGGRRARTAK